MKTIFAEDLKMGDVIVIPASSVSSQKKVKVISPLTLTETLVSGMGRMVKNGIELPIQFGRKVSLDIEEPLKASGEYVQVNVTPA